METENRPLEFFVEDGKSSLRHSGRYPAAGQRTVRVIVDSGDLAEVVVFQATEAVGLGTRFQHEGNTWEITKRRHDSGIFVASPWHID